MNRRHFLIAAYATTLSPIVPAFGQTPAPATAATTTASDVTIVSALPPLPADLADQASQPPAPYAETQLVGTAPPSTDEIDNAYDLLLNSPIGGAPIDVAQYFLAVGAGAYGEELRPFAREWPVRANPLIMHFFSSTQTKPEGDVTAWCAAFVNWCLLRARAASADEVGKGPGGYIKKGKPFAPENLKRYSTNNASSGSFRCWDETSSPQRGDIVVFRDIGTDNLTKVCRGSGHVTFFVKIPSAGRVQVLGGNQSQPGSNGAVTVANMSSQPGTRFMKYVSLKA
jgi:CHAP domain